MDMTELEMLKDKIAKMTKNTDYYKKIKINIYNLK